MRTLPGAVLMGVALLTLRAQAVDQDYQTLLQTYVRDGQVDYRGLQQDRGRLDNYLTRQAQVAKQDFDSWPQSTQLAYLINMYNAATLQLIIDHYPVATIKAIGGLFRSPWSLPVVHLFGDRISLDHLEHKIIRKWYREPRIHMALVCAAKGCPPLPSEPFVATRLDEQLTERTRYYLASDAGMRLDVQARVVYLSSIFKWYKEDFPAVATFVEEYSGKQIAGLKVRWISYDWGLNGQHIPP